MKNILNLKHAGHQGSASNDIDVYIDEVYLGLFYRIIIGKGRFSFQSACNVQLTGDQLIEIGKALNEVNTPKY